jgi:hypothetical protein
MDFSGEGGGGNILRYKNASEGGLYLIKTA